MKGNRMLSGNGRHRRPRQAPALLVAAGVTGSAIAIPLLGATGASAASGTTWDQVADCESGGSWSANTGNGYYGGLQLSQDDWEEYGGLDYASSADQASRSQQIAVAEKVLADKGVGVWRTCGLLHGLNKDSGSADVDTGVLGDLSSSSDSSDSSSSDDADQSAKADTGLNNSSESESRDSGSPQTNASKSGDSDESGQSGESSESSKGGESASDSGSDSESATSGAGRHRGGAADEGATDGRTDAGAGSTGRHASRNDDSVKEVEVPEDPYAPYLARVGGDLYGIVDSLAPSGG
ncbi:transglycosylase family protein [Streptomyces spongiae]|uniref:transglycosylase family protein n=1 Tax=Streptomyces spongiae TaxID=565072 RepID=UPI00389A46D5